jgi:hypothetical protein
MVQKTRKQRRYFKIVLNGLKQLFGSNLLKDGSNLLKDGSNLLKDLNHQIIFF